MPKPRTKLKSSKQSNTLKAGRPPLLSSARQFTPQTPSHKSSRATRTIIRAHHNLHKSRAKAIAEGNDALVASLDSQIAELGGLDAYQHASLIGQSKDRGGDSSIILVRWLQEAKVIGKIPRQDTTALDKSNTIDSHGSGLRVLEIGALSSKNAISGMLNRGISHVQRIDLQSQEPDLIQEIDFMAFPIPKIDEEKYHILSLSLVLNYVPSAAARGEMLKRARSFFQTIPSNPPDSDMQANKTDNESIIPCLFIVLPLPCITNSRYMTAPHLQRMMSALGFTSLRVHQSAKLHYELFRFCGGSARDQSTGTVFKKVEINPGSGRNNFCITVERN